MSLQIQVQQLSLFKGHTGSIYALAAASKQNHFYTGGSDRVVALWNMHNPDEGTMVARSSDVVYAILEDNVYSRLLIGQGSGGIHVIALNETKEERLLQFHTTSVFEIAKSIKHNCYVSLSGDGDVAIFDCHDLTLKKKLHLLDDKLRCAVFNQDESTIAIGAANGSVYMFSFPAMEPVRKWQAHQEGFSVNALSYVPGYTQLLSGSRDAHLNVFDAGNNFKLVHSIPAHNYAIYAIAYNPAGTLFATASRDKTVKIWNSETMEVVVRIDKEHYNGHSHSVNKLLWLDNDILITAGDDRNVILWGLEMLNVKC